MVNQRDSTVRKKFVTFMLLPHNSTREVWRINLPIWLANILLGLVGVIIVSILGYFIYSATITTRLIHYYALQAENKAQEQQIKAFFNKTKELETGIRELEERDQELREMLGLQKSQKKPLRLNNSVTTNTELTACMNQIQEHIQARLEEYRLLKDASTALVYKFNSYPSVAPVDSPIYSPMGWRTHPFTGRSEFHKGADIPTWIGYPVKAAADGIITYSGWSKGYGNTIIIDHTNGYKTIYAHNSRLIAKRGQKVYKGQVVSKAGNSGLSTGPHLHYEVQYKNSVINPSKFLDLNIRSARYL